MASLSERETTFRLDYENEEVRVYSNHPPVWTKMARLGIAPYKEWTVGGKPDGKFYRVPLERWRFPVRISTKKRSVSPEQRAASAERLRQARIGK